MSECRHATLVLLEAKSRKRCVHCHLTLSADELGEGPCPECLEARGERHSDFEDVPHNGETHPGYFCDDCGARIGGKQA